MQLTGKNLFMTQQYMRHSSPVTTEIYLHVETEQQDAEIAQRLYNRYHSATDQDDDRAQLAAILQTLTADQLQHLTGIAAALTR